MVQKNSIFEHFSHSEYVNNCYRDPEDIEIKGGGGEGGGGLGIKWVHPFRPITVFQIESSHLTCTAHPMTGFFMKWKNELRLLKTFI